MDGRAGPIQNAAAAVIDRVCAETAVGLHHDPTLHPREVVGQVEQDPCADHGERTIAVEGKEEDAAFSGAGRADVGSEIELIEGAGGWDRQRALPGDASGDPIHPEGDDASPG